MILERHGRHGYWSWYGRWQTVEVCFAGKGADTPCGREQTLRRLIPREVEPAWLEQIHSAQVVAADRGLNGRGDALITRTPALALSVVTADCVPVLLASEDGQVAAVHAGWRGLAQRILPATLQRFRRPDRRLTAWIGPAIGACCYEVSEAVAADVAAASSDQIVAPGRRGRPHLDLVAAAHAQLHEHPTIEVHTLKACTRCDPERLWSYRRDGPRAGRNFATIWHTPTRSGTSTS